MSNPTTAEIAEMIRTHEQAERKLIEQGGKPIRIVDYLSILKPRVSTPSPEAQELYLKCRQLQCLSS